LIEKTSATDSENELLRQAEIQNAVTSNIVSISSSNSSASSSSSEEDSKFGQQR
jgi:hypothetical protein